MLCSAVVHTCPAGVKHWVSHVTFLRRPFDRTARSVDVERLGSKIHTPPIRIESKLFRRFFGAGGGGVG
eukprot:3715699-Pyramimonas_sp.AAC.1